MRADGKDPDDPARATGFIDILKPPDLSHEGLNGTLFTGCSPAHTQASRLPAGCQGTGGHAVDRRFP